MAEPVTSQAPKSRNASHRVRTRALSCLCSHMRHLSLDTTRESHATRNYTLWDSMHACLDCMMRRCWAKFGSQNAFKRVTFPDSTSPFSCVASIACMKYVPSEMMSRKRSEVPPLVAAIFLMSISWSVGFAEVSPLYIRWIAPAVSAMPPQSAPNAREPAESFVRAKSPA